MDFEQLYIPEDFIYDITSVPGSSDEVCLKAIDHYQKQLSRTGLHPKLSEIARGIIGALTEYYDMASFESERLRNVLPHLSEAARFMEAQTSVGIDVESSGRIKSFYSEYVKIIEKITEYVEKDKPIPEHDLLEDTWATRDILHPRHDMKSNPQAFYKETYGLIIDFMEYIDDLNKKDPRYGLKEYSEDKLLDLQRPKQYSFPPEDTVSIPEKNFLEYAFEIKGLQEGFEHLPELSNETDIQNLKTQIEVFQNSSDIIRKDLPLTKSITDKAKFDQLIVHRNEIEAEILDKLSDDTLKNYESLSFNDFFKQNKFKLSAIQRDKLKYLDYLNKYIKNCKSSNFEISLVNLPKFESSNFEEQLTSKLGNLINEQIKLIEERLNLIKELDLSNFEADYAEASKLKRFSRCGKDYMKNPKKSGYQSFHMIVETPYGPYEKQIRTQQQDDFAERGHASHSNSYKPDVKSTFHSLKVTTPFSPKRDANGNIIIPTELGILPFELAVYNYYKQPFSNFSGGKNLAEFKAEHPTKEDFYNALLALSPAKVSQNLITKLWNKLFHKKKLDVPKIVQVQPTYTASHYSDVPEDISAYPSISKGNNNKGPSTDDSDPHGNR